MAHTSVTVTAPAAPAGRVVLESQAEGATVTDLLREHFGDDITLAAPTRGAWCDVHTDEGVRLAAVLGYFGNFGALAPAHLAAR